MESTYCGTDQGPYKVAFYCNAVISCTKHGLTSRLLASMLGLGRLWKVGGRRGLKTLGTRFENRVLGV